MCIAVAEYVTKTFLKDSVFSAEAEANVLLVQVSFGELLFIFKRQILAFKSSSTYLK